MPPKAKPDTAAYQKLKKDIKEGTIGTLYVFHGEEAYLRDFYLGQLKKKLLPAGMEEFNLHTFQPKECDPKRLEQAVDNIEKLHRLLRGMAKWTGRCWWRMNSPYWTPIWESKAAGLNRGCPMSSSWMTV